MRGGKRDGAGRPVGTSKKAKKVMVSVRLPHDIISWLNQFKNKTSVIENAIRDKMKQV